MKKVLITGINGFVGKHLTEHLLATGDYEIIGTTRSDKGDVSEKVTLEKVDLLDAAAVEKLIVTHKPDQIYHLAAMTSPAESFKDPTTTLTNNMLAQIYVLEALRKHEMTNTRVLVISTSEIYGIVDPSDLPVDEDTKLRPFSPYAVSKITQYYLGLQYHLSSKLDVVRVRPFNHVGPGQTDVFVLPSFAKQIAAIEKNQQQPVIKVGNLEAKRDFTDVRDVVRAYRLLMEKGVNGDVYNLGSGKSQKVGDLLHKLLSFSSVEIAVEVDPAKVRPLDVEEIRADYSKLSQLTGWQPEILIESTLQDILDYWRNIV